MRQSVKIASYPECDRYQRGLASIIFKFFDKTSPGSGAIRSMSNQHLANELHKQLLQDLKEAEFILHLEIIFGCWSSWYAVNYVVCN